MPKQYMSCGQLGCIGNLAALATWQLWHLIKGASGAKKVPKRKAAMCQTTISNHKKDEINYKIKVA
jgi:hypothetical protein